jgi:vitamin B12 transporter
MIYSTVCAGLALLGSAAAATLHAEDSQDNLETIVVTATRTPIAIEQVLVPVTVIDRPTIERQGATDLSELLRFQAGLDVVRTGGPGQQTSVFTRGTESNHTLVLVDGVRINSGSVGIAAVENISPEIIERVEIVRGPRTSLYGEDAIGGVINVITRRPAGGELEVAAGYGADDTRRLSLATGARWGDLEAGLTVNTLKTDGFPVVTGTTQDQGFDNLTLNAVAGTELGAVRTEARLWQSHGTTDYLAQDCAAFPEPCTDVGVDQDYLNRAIALRVSFQPAASWQSALDGSVVTDDVDQNQSADFVRTERRILDWQNTITPGAGHLLVAGLYLADDDVEAISYGAPLVTDDTAVSAVYVEDNLNAGRHQLGLAGRYSDHDAYGAKLTWNAEYGFALRPGLRLLATAGRAVRAPNATERYDSFGGNPDLRPEDSVAFGAGLQWEAAPAHRFGVNAYRIDIEDLIGFAVRTDPVTGAPIFRQENIDRAEISGLEVTYDLSGSRWQGRAAVVVQNPEDEATGNTLPRRSQVSFSASLARNLGRHQIGIDLLAVGQREDFAGQLAGYGLANLTGMYAMSPRMELRLRLENLLDRDYAPAYYDFGRLYAAPGRGLYAEVRYDLR